MLGYFLLKCVFVRNLYVIFYIKFQTPTDHPDAPLIEEAIKVVEKVIDVVDKKTGESKCQFTRSKLEYLDEKTVSCFHQIIIYITPLRYWWVSIFYTDENNVLNIYVSLFVAEEFTYRRIQCHTL